MANARKSAKPDLRRRGTAKVKARKQARRSVTSRALQELEVHQAELVVQNEALRAARSQAEAAREQLTEVFDFAPLGYVVLDRQGTIQEINHAGARLLGAERVRFIAEPFPAFIVGDGLRRFDVLMSTALSYASPASCELELHTASGRTPVRLTASVLRRGDIKLLLAFEDISLRRAKEQQLARTEAALRELNARKDELLAMLSHELRNPLAPIRTSVAVLHLTEPGSTMARDAIDIIDRSAAQLTRLVDDLLDVTRITRGTIQLQRSPLELVGLVARTVEDHRASFASRKLTLETSFASRELWLDGDGARLVQVVSNVLGNSEKFTPAGGRVRVSVAFEDGHAILKVVDTGIGIAPELMPSLFEPFAQAPQQLDRSAGGLGLGLALVKTLVELHDGRVSIASPGLGAGTEVVIRLPAQQQALDAGARLVVPARTARRVLIIEDMVDTAQSLRSALVLKGHDVRIAYDGATGIEEMARFQPDVVLCDIGLPDMDGYTVAMRARSDIMLRDIYLVALSGYARPEDIARATAAGFHRHLAKPPQLDELQELLDNIPDLPRWPDGGEHNTLH